MGIKRICCDHERIDHNKILKRKERKKHRRMTDNQSEKEVRGSKKFQRKFHIGVKTEQKGGRM